MLEENSTVLDLPKIMREQKQSMRRKKVQAIEAEKQRVRRNRSLKIKFFSIFVVVFFVATYWFATNYRLQNPFVVSLQPFVVKIEAESMLTPLAQAKEPEPKILTDMETIEQYKYSVIMKGMYRKESSAGKNDYCKEKGQFNGFGYRQNSRENKCYESFDEVTERVNEWLEVELTARNNNVIQTLCWYNMGVETDSCDYATEVLGFMVEYL